MFERFTDRARRVVVMAQEEARLMQHNYIGTEHLLLGLLASEDDPIAEILDGMGCGLTEARADVERIIGKGLSESSGHIPFTPRAKKVLELSLRESLNQGDDYIGSGHILLGVIREGEGVATQILTELRVDQEELERQIVDSMHRAGPDPVGRRPFVRGAEIKTVVEEMQRRIAELETRLTALENRMES